MQLMYLLCDKDRKFGMRLAEYLEKQKEFCYPLMLFSEKSELMRYLSACHDKGMKIIVVSAEYADEIEDKEKYRRVFKICSSAGEAVDEDSFFRYMGASKIMTRLLSGTVRKVNALPENPRVIGFYGPVKRIGQTSSAISLCCLLMEKGKVLYVSILGIAKLTDEAGEGDAVMLFVIGIFLGRINTFVILFTAVSLAFSIGGLIILCNGTKKKEIPFAPFLFGGYITAILTGAV